MIAYAKKRYDGCTVCLADSSDCGCNNTPCNCFNWSDGEYIEHYSHIEKVEEKQPCGHPKSSIVSDEEGTCYCGECEKEEKMNDLRMDAYYYSFHSTGVHEIDLILSAVACAGKLYHHTADWQDETPKYHDEFEGETPEEWIQNAANNAAAILSENMINKIFERLKVIKDSGEMI